MDADKNSDKHSTETKNPGSDYETPFQTPNSVLATPVPRRFVDFTFSSSDDSTLSSTPLDPKLVEELLGSTDSSGKSLNESLSNTYSTLLSSEKGSGTESTFALSPLLNETSNTEEMLLAESCVSEPDRSEDDLNEAELFYISGEQVLADSPKDIDKSQKIVRQLKEAVGDKVLHDEDDCESNASSYTTSKDEENLETELENLVWSPKPTFEEPKGILGSFKELSETLPSRVELTKNRFEISVEVNESFLNEPVAENTFFRDLDDPKFNSESLELDTSTEGGSKSGQRTNLSTENLSTEVNRDVLSSPNRSGLKANVSKIDGVRKILKDFFSFSKVKEFDEKKHDDLQSLKAKRSGTDMVSGNGSSKSSWIDTPRNLQTSSSSRIYKEPDCIPESPPTVIADDNSNDGERESFLENTPISNCEMETSREKKNETSDSLSRNVFYKLDSELAMDLDRDLYLIDTSSESKESGLEQNKSPSTSKITLSQNLTTNNIFSLSFNADDLKKEHKFKEDTEKKMIADIQELKSKRFQNTYLNNELSYAKILREIKKEPIFENTFESEFKESNSDLGPRNTKELEGCKTMDIEETSLKDNPLWFSRSDTLKENFLKYTDLKTDDNVMRHNKNPSFKVQRLDEFGDVHTTRATNERSLCGSKKTPAFLFSDPIACCMDNIKNQLCSREEESTVSFSKNQEINGFSSLKNTQETPESELDDSYTSHTCKKYHNLSPCKVVGRLKKSPQEITKAIECETDHRPMDITTEKADKGATIIQFDKSVARGVMRALTDMESKKGVLLTQIKKFVVQKRLVRIDSKVDKEIERFMVTAQELGIVTKKGARFYPHIKASKATISKTKKVNSMKKEASVKHKSVSPTSKKIAVKVATPSSRRLEMYRQKAMNSPIPLLNLRTRRALSSKESVKELRESKREAVFKSLRSRVIQID